MPVFMQTVDRKLGFSIYCTFHKHPNSKVQKPADDCVFRCCQLSYPNGPLRETKLYFTGSKGNSLRFVDFDPFCVSLFQGLSLVIVMMIDGSEKHNCEGGF